MKRRVGLGLVAAGALVWALTTALGGPGRMSDALPLYLYGAAWLEGLSPVARESLQQVYADRGMDVAAALWSTLYPATVGPIFAPLALLSWTAFTKVWATLLVLSGAAVGALVPRKGDPWVLAAAGVALAAGFEPMAEAARLGQVNVLLAALCAAGLLALDRRRDGLGGALFGLAAAIKLVPVFAAVPLAWRHKKAVLGGLAVGLPLLGLAFLHTPPTEFVEALQATALFQSTIAPHWMITGELPTWALKLAEVRHGGLGVVSVAGAAIVGLWRPGPRVVVGGSLAVLAWLGTDAVAFHILYAPLYLPAVVWVGTWCLEDDAPRWSIGLSVAVAAVALGLPRVDLFVNDPTVSGMLLGYAVWLAVVVRTGVHAWACDERGPLAVLERWPTPVAAALGVATMVAFVRPLVMKSAPPPGAVAGQEIRHAGPGFLEVAEGPDIGPGTLGGAHKRWTELTVVGRLGGGSRQALDVHLSSASERWTALGEDDLAAAVPTGPVRKLTVEELTVFLAAEGARLAELGHPEPLTSEWRRAVEPR